MSKLTDDQVRHIAKLARLRIKDDEVGKYSKELTSILDFIDQLQEVDTSNVEIEGNPTGMTNSFRDDEIRKSDVNPEELLATSPLPIVENQIQTPSAHG